MKQSKRRPANVSAEDVALDKEVAHADIQQGAERSIPKQEQLKEKVQQHPQRELPRIESIEPTETPPRI
jgi:hypothetical protein